MRERVVVVSGAPVAIDSLSVVPGSLQVWRGLEELSDTLYSISFEKALLSFHPSLMGNTLRVNYRVLPLRIPERVARKDLALLRPSGSGKFNPYRVGINSGDDALPGSEALQRSGSVSRGVAFGNAQNLTVNSTLNLQLSGKINERFSVMGSITDDNIPVQPNGSSQQLQDFDQVFIQLYDERSKIIAGDFVLRRPTGYFMNYFKRAQGAYFFTDQTLGKKSKRLSVEASAAVSKGRFARNVIQGVEGNQGPYRLRGADNEAFIIVLAGTEAVFIDGRKLERGQDRDYVIDYNSAEITFTPRNLITKDRRIAVEFQYSEKRYARPMLQSSVMWGDTRGKIYLNVFSEGDAKNQPLQQELSDADKALLAAAGDDINAASRSGIQRVSFSASEVLYAMVDSLGFDSVLVYTADSSLAKYRSTFTLVGLGNGDYVEDGFTANGKKYKWVVPEVIGNTLVRKGSYAPIVVLSAPKKSQMLVFGTEQASASGKWKWVAEGAFTNYDQNTFSTIGNNDNLGAAFKTGIATNAPDVKQMPKKNAVGVAASYEYTSAHFQRIERFREVEFERNWNILGQPQNFDQHIAGTELKWWRKNAGNAGIGAEALRVGEQFNGWKAVANSDFLTSKWKAWVNASWLLTDGWKNSSFLRHRSDLYYNAGKVRIGFIDEQESNLMRYQETDSLLTSTYRFYDWQVYVGTQDTSKTQFRAYFRRRTDDKPDGSLLSAVARADEYGTKVAGNITREHRISTTISNRVLRVVDPERFTSAPENTLVGRVEYQGRAKKNWWQCNTFYEVGSGLEQRREFVYLEVQPGQGVYVWNDYNANGVKELNEFEIAAFSYEANYIRAFVQSAEYVKTFTNQFSQTLQLSPEQVLSKSTVRWKKWLAKWSSQTAYKVDRKTGRENGSARFNPFLNAANDSTLLATNQSFRQIFFLNKTHPKWGVDYTIQQTRGKSLLSNGFESRTDNYLQAGVRWNITGTFTFTTEHRKGTRSLASDFLSGRNFVIDYTSIKPKLNWQPSNTQRWSATAEFTQKNNRSMEGSGEAATLWKSGIEGTVSNTDKGALQVQMNYIRIVYNGSVNSSLAFEMLEGLNAGNNFTWSATVQKTVAKNLQLNLTYNGRKPQDIPTIHSGGVQLRAFF